MEAIFISNDRILLEVSREELFTICSTLNEVCSCVKKEDFEAIIGIPFDIAQSYIHDLIDAYVKIRTESTEI